MADRFDVNHDKYMQALNKLLTEDTNFPFVKGSAESLLWCFIESTRQGAGMSRIQAIDSLYKVIGHYVVLNEQERYRVKDGATISA